MGVRLKNLDDKFKKGKHRGLTVQQVIDNKDDSQYLRFMTDNKYMYFSPEVWRYVENKEKLII